MKKSPLFLVFGLIFVFSLAISVIGQRSLDQANSPCIPHGDMVYSVSPGGDPGQPDTLSFPGYPCSADGDTLFVPVGGGYARIHINVWNDNSISGICVPLIESVSGPPGFAFVDQAHQNASLTPLCYSGSRIEGWGSLNLDMSIYPPKLMYGAVTFAAAMPPGDGLVATMVYTVRDTGRICLDTTFYPPA